MEIPKKRWKRLGRKLLLGFLAFLLLFFVLFSLFLFNPLERKYPKDLSSLLPMESDAAFYLPAPEAVFWKLYKFIDWEDWANKKETQAFLKNPIYENFFNKMQYKEIIKQREQIQKKYSIDLVSLLREIVGKEIIAAVRFSQKEGIFHWLAASRISFKMKTLYSLASYLPKSLQERLSLQAKKGIVSLSPSPGESLYFMRQRDILLVSNDESFLRAAREDGKNLALLAKKPLLQELWSEKASEVFFYLDSASLLQAAPQQGITINPQLREALASIQSLWGELTLTKGKMELTFRMPSPQGIQEYFSQIPADEAGKIPQESLFYITASIPWKILLLHWKSHLPQEWQKDVLFYEKILIRHYGEDFLSRHIANFLENETLVVLSRLDFIKENLAPLDPYPGVALLIRSSDAERLLSTMDSFTQRILDETLKKEWKEEGVQLILREKYADKEYLRIKFPDVSGGAIRPSVGVLGDYLVLTSHAAFYKNLLDVKDKLEAGLDKNRAYRNFAWKGPFRLFLDGEQLLKTAEELRPQIIDWITFLSASQNRRRKVNKTTVTQRWDEGIQIFRLFHTNLAVDFSMENDLLTGKATLALDARR